MLGQGKIWSITSATVVITGRSSRLWMVSGPTYHRQPPQKARARHQSGGPPAIDGVSLQLSPGRRVALVGSYGAGKSTVAAVLLRFMELAGGLAKLNGSRIADFQAGPSHSGDHARFQLPGSG
jgi:ABC-type glutathione transport system ATPase component